MVVSSGSSRARWVSTRRRTKGSATSAVTPPRLLLYLRSLATGGRLAWRRAVWTWPYSSARWRTRRRRARRRSRSPLLFGVGVGEGEGAALEQSGDGLGVVPVALGFGAVDGFHGPGVSEGEGDVGVSAGVGQPVPAVHALASDDDSVLEGLDGFEEGLGGGGEVAAEPGLSVLVEDAEEEGPGVEIDAGVESDAGGGLKQRMGKASG